MEDSKELLSLGENLRITKSIAGENMNWDV
jgi:hypothetical protein